MYLHINVQPESDKKCRRNPFTFRRSPPAEGQILVGISFWEASKPSLCQHKLNMGKFSFGAAPHEPMSPHTHINEQPKTFPYSNPPPPLGVPPQLPLGISFPEASKHQLRPTQARHEPMSSSKPRKTESPPNSGFFRPQSGLLERPKMAQTPSLLGWHRPDTTGD